jgi:hypothetical protein
VHFNADQYLAALEKPEFTAGGKHYVGRLLSFEEMVPFEPRLKELDSFTPEQAGAQYLASKRLVRDLMDTMFPRPWWKVWEGKASAAMAKLPYQAQMKALSGFLRCQTEAMKMAAPAGGTEQPEPGA